MLKKIVSHKISQNIFALGILQISNYILPLMILPFLTRKLGLENFGILMIIYSIYAFSAIITDFGFNLSATYEISQKQKNKMVINQIISDISFIKFNLSIITASISLLYIAFQLPSFNLNTNLITIIFLTIVFQSFQYTWLFQGIEKMKYITTTFLASKLLYISLLFLFSNQISTQIALLCFLISQIFLFLSQLFLIRREGLKFIKIKKQSVIKQLKKSSIFFLSRLSVSTYTVINTILIGSTNGAIVAGLYSSAEKLYGAGNNISGVISQALYPYMARTKNINLLIKLTTLFFIPFAIICTIVALYSEQIITIIFGTDFIGASEYLKIFLVLMCITFISILIGYPGFSTIGKIKYANYSVIIGSVIHIVGLIILYFLNKVSPKSILFMIVFTETFILLVRVSLLSYFYQKNLRIMMKAIRSQT